MYKLALIILLSIFSFGDNLTLKKGEIKAHTEIFGDSNIDPKTEDIVSVLTKEEDIESLKGKITINPLSLKSDDLSRDKHMYEVLNTKSNPLIYFEIRRIQKIDTNYKIIGFLTLNGIKKYISSKVVIVEDNQLLNLTGSFSIKLTQFNIEPPSLLFLTVRDQIDIDYKLSYTKEK